MDNLKVTPDFLRQLAQKQTNAADTISTATAQTEGLAKKVKSTHGVVCKARIHPSRQPKRSANELSPSWRQFPNKPLSDSLKASTTTRPPTASPVT